MVENIVHLSDYRDRARRSPRKPIPIHGGEVRRIKVDQSTESLLVPNSFDGVVIGHPTELFDYDLMQFDGQGVNERLAETAILDPENYQVTAEQTWSRVMSAQTMFVLDRIPVRHQRAMIKRVMEEAWLHAVEISSEQLQQEVIEQVRNNLRPEDAEGFLRWLGETNPFMIPPEEVTP